ncbi:hypothetical protein A6R68_09733, partial [Neotoma lepida]
GGDERGLLSLAFHPNYKKNGKLYVSYTTNQERKNPHQVDVRTARVFLEVAELHRKHLGGQLLFGPDGFLYIILGDGMITLDDMEEMDGLSDFTGSVLRLDVDTDMCNVPYSIPRSNPHFNSTNQPPEVFAHGLHDPGRCAVDRHPTDININLTILCSDSNGKNRSSARILQIIKGKDYGEVYILSSSKSMTQTHNGKLYKIIDPKRRQASNFSPKVVGLAASPKPNVSHHVVTEVSASDRTSASVRKAILVLSVNKWTEASAELPGQ